MKVMTKRISLVIPAYNEESNISLLRRRLAELEKSANGYMFEIIIVDDHSSDQTPSLVKAWGNEDGCLNLTTRRIHYGD